MKEIAMKNLEATKAEDAQNFIGSAFKAVCYIATVKSICKLLKLSLEGKQIFRAITCIVMLGVVTGLAGAQYIGEMSGTGKNTEQNAAKRAE